MKYFFRNLMFVFLLLVIAGCEKSLMSFTANSVQPFQGKVSAHVISGGNPVSNALVNATDPNGNIFSAITDSNGIAFFDPTPFSNGAWTFILPNQAHRCIEQSSNLTITPNSSSQSITFQYGVIVSL